MLLHDLMEGMDLSLVSGSADIPIHNLSDDTRQISRQKRGSLFIARGHHEPTIKQHVLEAIEQGADAILCHKNYMQTLRSNIDSSVTWLTGSCINQVLVGQLAERFYDHPSKKLKIIGITGTNGKTTTSLMLAHLLNQTGIRCGVIGSIWVNDGRSTETANLTTPGALELAAIQSRMVANGCKAAVMEVSSHALSQGRTDACCFDVAIFTNLASDHLDYHETVDQYAAAKARLFSQLSKQATAVINTDDPHAPTMLRDCQAQVIPCTLQTPPTCPPSDNTCFAKVLQLASNHSHIAFHGPWGHTDLKLPFIGRHNAYNALQALAAASVLSFPTTQLVQKMETCPPVPGRLEPVGTPPHHGPFVVVDYAHTPDALQHALNSLRPLTKGRLLALFGAGGNRDTTKRAEMAAVACKLADHVVITSDNPRTEPPQAIIDGILKGVPAEMKVRIEPDRGKAIELVIAQATDADTVLLAGKGHETYQEINGIRYPFDDRLHAVEALNQKST